jgi:hypothetical protein
LYARAVTCLTLALWCASAFGGNAALTWTAPTKNVDGTSAVVSGYRVYERCNAGPQTQVADTTALTYTHSGIPDDGRTCWWSITAYDSNGESAHTNEVSKTFALAKPGATTATYTFVIGQVAQPPPPSMAATLTGTPENIVWATGNNPAAQNITVPANTTAVYAFWAAFSTGGSSGWGINTITLGGSAPDQILNRLAGSPADANATGVAVWYNPGTGTKSLDISWSGVSAPDYGPLTTVVYTKDGDTTAWRDADSDANSASNAVSVTLTTNAADLVIKFDVNDVSGGGPGTSAGWTSQQTQTNASSGNALVSRTSTADSPGAATTVCNAENEDYSSLVAISIPAAAGGGASASLPPVNKASRMAAMIAH